MNGIWIAYYSDWSSVVAFTDEVDALRWAVKNTMLVKFVEFGAEVISFAS